MRLTLDQYTAQEVALIGSFGRRTSLLERHLTHDVSRLPLAEKVRITEDCVEKTIDKVGLVKSVTKIRGYRQDFLDERMGIVWLRMAWGGDRPPRNGGQRTELTVWESFNIYDGKIHAVEAFMKNMPVGLGSGWPGTNIQR